MAQPFGKTAELSVDRQLGLSTLRRKIQAFFAYFYKVPYFVPYWNRKTYGALAKCFLSGTVINGRELERLPGRLKQIFSGTEMIPCGQGRVAIELALRALDVSEGSEVILPSFCCASVLQPVLAAGATPVLADVGEELNLTVDTVERALSSRTRAIIVPHLFGNPANIQPIVELARVKRIFVIDDAAQALGGRLDGKPLGAFGDAGVLSFGKGKVCFGTGGGVLLASHSDLLERTRKIVLAQGSFSEGLKNALAILLWRRWRRWSLPLQVLLSRMRRKSKDREGWPGGGHSYPREAMKNLDVAVALTLLDTL